jgi:hypothetical protein
VAGIRRSRAGPPARKTAAGANVIRDILRAITGASLMGARDRALINRERF